MVLHKLEFIYAALYDLFNRRFLVSESAMGFCSVTHEDHSDTFQVDYAFRVILLKSDKDLFTDAAHIEKVLPSPLMNRFEKHILGLEDFALRTETASGPTRLASAELKLRVLQRLAKLLVDSGLACARQDCLEQLSELIFCFARGDLVRQVCRDAPADDRGTFPDTLQPLVKFYSFKMFLIHYTQLRRSFESQMAEDLRRLFLETHQFDSLEEFLARERAHPLAEAPRGPEKSVVLTRSKFSTLSLDAVEVLVSDLEQRGSDALKTELLDFLSPGQASGSLLVHFNSKSNPAHFAFLRHQIDNWLTEFASQGASFGPEKQIVLVVYETGEEPDAGAHFSEGDWHYFVLESLDGCDYRGNMSYLDSSTQQVLARLSGHGRGSFRRSMLLAHLGELALEGHCKDIVRNQLLPALVYADQNDCSGEALQIFDMLRDQLVPPDAVSGLRDWRELAVSSGTYKSVRQTIMASCKSVHSSNLRRLVLRLQKEQLIATVVTLPWLPQGFRADFLAEFQRGVRDQLTDFGYTFTARVTPSGPSDPGEASRSEPNKSFLTPFFQSTFRRLEARLAPLLEQAFPRLQKSFCRSDRLYAKMVELVVESCSVGVFANQGALWVLFRDSYVLLAMPRTDFFDFAYGNDPFDCVRAVFPDDSGSTRSRIRINLPQPESPGRSEQSPRGPRPGMLYVVELISFNLMGRLHEQSGSPTRDNAFFRVFADFVIWAKLEGDSLTALAKAVSFVPVDSGLFRELASRLAELRIDGHFFSNGDLRRFLLGFLLSRLEGVFDCLSVQSAFALVRHLLQLWEATPDAQSRRPSLPCERPDKLPCKPQLRSFLALEAFFLGAQARLFQSDLRALQRMLLDPNRNVCEPFFLQSRDDSDCEISFAEFAGRNNTVPTVELINHHKQAVKMTIFGKNRREDWFPRSEHLQETQRAESQELTVLPESDQRSQSSAHLRSMHTYNCELLRSPSLYMRLRLLFQADRPLSQSSAFQRLLVFLFRCLLERAVEEPNLPPKLVKPLEQHFHLLVADCANLNAIVGLLLDITYNFGGRTQEVLTWVTRSPNERFLQILIDRQTLSARPDQTERFDSILSRSRMLEQLDIGGSSRTRVIVRLIELYEQALTDPREDPSSRGWTLFMTLFQLRSELWDLLCETTPQHADSLLALGKHLAPENATPSQSRVRSTVLIHLLGNLQKRFDFLSDPESEFLPLVPESLASVWSSTLRTFKESLRGHPWNSARAFSAKLETLLQEPRVPSSGGLSGAGFYNLITDLVNLRQSPPASFADHEILFERVASQCGPAQRLLLKAILNNFPAQEGAGLWGDYKQRDTDVIKLIVSVTLSAIVDAPDSWFLPRLLADLREGQTRRVPFNFKQLAQSRSESAKTHSRDRSHWRFFACAHCKSAFLAADTPGPARTGVVCVGCKRQIKRVSPDNPDQASSEAIEISLGQYQEYLRESPFYEVHESLEPTATTEPLEQFGFRLGHLLTHCLFAGAELAGLADCGLLLVPNIQVSHPHLGVAREQSFGYFFEHARRDSKWLRSNLGLKKFPLDFVGFVLQDIRENPPRGNPEDPVARVECRFSVLAESYRARLAEIRAQIDGKRGGETIVRRALRREVDFEDVSQGVDRYLFLNLRQTADLSLAKLRGEVDKRNNEHFLLKLYLQYRVSSLRA